MNTLHQLIAENWEFQMRESPLFATLCGDHRYDHQLPGLAPADHQRRDAQNREFLRQLNAIERHSLSAADQLNYDMFERELKDAIADFDFQTHLIPFTRIGGFHTDFFDVPDSMSFVTLHDYENYLARLNSFKAHVEDVTALLRAGIQAGFTATTIAVEGLLKGLQANIVTDPTRSVLYQPFAQFAPTIGEADRQRLTAAGQTTIMNFIMPGLQQLLDFVQNSYVPHAQTDISIAALPNGSAFYEHCIRKNTTLDVSPQQVHDIGQAEVTRIRAEMEAIIRQLAFQGTFQDFVQFLRTDPRFYVDTPAALMKEASLILKKMDGELPTLFKFLPRTPYGIRPVPDYSAPHNTTAYYFQPTGDGRRAGFYYINTYDLKSRPLYELEALSLHEAVPGHHLHIALQMELDLPNFRRFGWITAYGEGWALYSERLGLEVGFYQDPYSNFGRLIYEMWRACRLAVDTGIHALGWSRQQAVDFMAENTALTVLNIQNEVDRYISWPGQAVSYKMGELKIRELRAFAEKALGPAFDIRAFHYEILRDGCIPLTVLEKRIQHWATETARGGLA